MSHQETSEPHINTRAAWRPILKPIARVLIAAQLALVLQPLSALAHEHGERVFNPVADAQVQRLAQLDQRIQQAKAQSAAANKNPADQVSDKLAQAEELVHKLQRPGTPDKPGKHQQLKALLADINTGTADVRADFAATRSHLQARRLPATILQRHDDAVAAFEERAARFNQLAALADDNQRVTALAEFYAQYPTRRKPLPLGKKLPWSTPEPNKRLPAETRTAWYQNLWGDQQVRLAQAGGSIGAIQFNIPPEPGVAPTTADLAETDEIVLTDGIRAKAGELGNNAVKIYNWVRNNIEWTPTNGAIQSAQDTLDKLRGNATDTASLLIALLRAANIPARYQWGTIDVPADKAMNWVGGATVPQAALQIMSQGGIAARGIGGGGQVTTIRMEHVWVSAYVNWMPSRGNRQGGAAASPQIRTPDGQLQHVNPNANLNAWVPLDAAFKQYTYAPGMDLKTAVPLDANALLSAAQQGATVNTQEGWVQNLNQAAIQTQLTDYQSRLQTYINSTPTGANSTVGDVIGKKIVAQSAPSLLAGVTPNPVVVQTSQATAVPGNLQHKFTYSLYASQTDQATGTALLTYTEKTSKLVGKRLTITYVPATQADADVIASYLPAPHADGSPIQPSELPKSLPGYLIKLRAQISLRGQPAAEASQALPMGTDLYSTGGFTQLYDTNQWDLTSEETNVVGNITAIGVSAGGISLWQVDRLRKNMSANLSMMQAALIDSLMLQELQGESIVGDLLSAGIWTWFARADVHTRDMERTNGVLAAQGGSYGLLHVALHPTSAWGVVKNVTFPGVSFDVAHVRIATAASDASVESWKSFNRSHGSYLSSQEHALLEEIFSDPSKCNSQSASVQDPLLVDCPQGISSVRALSLASQTGQKVFTITAGTFSSNPRFVSENLSAHSDAMREKVEQALLAGFDVTVHDAPIASQGWTGAGFVITDPASGSGGYLLDGGANGGWLSLVTNAAGALVVITLLVGKLQAAGLIAALSAPFGFYLLAFGVLAITAFVMAEYFYGGYTYDCDGISTCHYPENIAKMGLFATTMKLIQAGLSGNLMALVAGLLLLAEIVKGKA